MSVPTPKNNSISEHRLHRSTQAITEDTRPNNVIKNVSQQNILTRMHIKIWVNSKNILDCNICHWTFKAQFTHKRKWCSMVLNRTSSISGYQVASLAFVLCIAQDNWHPELGFQIRIDQGVVWGLQNSYL